MSETIRFPIKGMTCTSCLNRVTRTLRRLDGVEHVKVDLGRETATVRRQSSLASDEALAAAVAGAGYEADLTAAVVLPIVVRPSVVARFLARVRS